MSAALSQFASTIGAGLFRKVAMNWSRIAFAVSVVDLLVLGILAGRGVIGPAEAETDGTTPVVRAEMIELVDGNGLMRAQFKTEENGTVVLRLRDEAATFASSSLPTSLAPPCSSRIIGPRSASTCSQA
jgi:hypothetical protein